MDNEAIWRGRLERKLGRLVLVAGWAEHSLGELSKLLHPDQSDHQPAAWGHSGKRLVGGLAALGNPDVTALARRYADLSGWRNKFIHCGWTPFGDEAATAWHAPIMKDEVHLRCYTITFEQFEEFIAAWEQLEAAVDVEITAAMKRIDEARET